MKKALLLLLSVVLVFALGASALAEDEAHTLWNIPWDTPMADIIDVVYANSGIAINSLWKPYYFSSSAIQGIKILGRDVQDVIFAYDESCTRLSAAGIAFFPNDYSIDLVLEEVRNGDKPILEGIIPIAEIYNTLCQKYGTYDESIIIIKNDEKEEIPNKLHKITSAEDFNGLLGLALNHEYLCVCFTWENVRMIAELNTTSDTVSISPMIDYSNPMDAVRMDESLQTTSEIDLKDYLFPRAVDIGL